MLAFSYFYSSAISRNLNLDPPNPFENCKCVLRIDICYLKEFDDNNNINGKNIAFTLGEFWTHFIGTKASKVHFFKKMVNLTHSYSICLERQYIFLHFSGLRQNLKQDRVRFGYDREDNIIEDLNTLSALYDEIQSNVNSLHQWVPLLAYLGDIHIFLIFLT